MCTAQAALGPAGLSGATCMEEQYEWLAQQALQRAQHRAGSK